MSNLLLLLILASNFFSSINENFLNDALDFACKFMYIHNTEDEKHIIESILFKNNTLLFLIQNILKADICPENLLTKTHFSPFVSFRFFFYFFPSEEEEPPPVYGEKQVQFCSLFFLIFKHFDIDNYYLIIGFCLFCFVSFICFLGGFFAVFLSFYSC